MTTEMYRHWVKEQYYDREVELTVEISSCAPHYPITAIADALEDLVKKLRQVEASTQEDGAWPTDYEFVASDAYLVAEIIPRMRDESL